MGLTIVSTGGLLLAVLIVVEVEKATSLVEDEMIVELSGVAKVKSVPPRLEKVPDLESGRPPDTVLEASGGFLVGEDVAIFLSDLEVDSGD